jgi:hypothetical protein
MKPHEKLLERNPLSNTPYRNTGMVLNGQGPGHHSFGDASYLDLDTVLSEQGSDWSNTCWENQWEIYFVAPYQITSTFLLNLWSREIRGETDQTRVERILAEMVNMVFMLHWL